MKRQIRILICLVLALALCVLTACNGGQDGQTGNSSRYAGKYYQVIGENLSPNSWYELKSDWTWVDNDGETGKFSVDGSTIKIYWLFDDEEAFDGYISGDEIIFYVFGINQTYRKGNPSQPSQPQQPSTPDKWTITFDVNGGDSSHSPQSYEGGASLSDLPIPTRSGYTFLNWRGSDGRIYSRTSTMPYNDLRLTAQWEKIVTSFEDNYVFFKPAIEGKKLGSGAYAQYESMGINTYAYVELTSSDLGGRYRVGELNNFDLSQHVNMEYYAKDDYNLNWYVGDFNTPNGAQLFSLDYGSNPQLLTVTQGSRVVRRYLIDIYVKYDFEIKLFSNVYDTRPNSQPYSTYWVTEGETVPETISKYTRYNYTPSDFVYYTQTNELATFKFDTVIYDNWNLYQTYEQKEITANLDGGSLNGSLSIKPYTPYQTLSVPTKEGYDFIGWKTPNGSYFTDLVGYSASKYMSADNSFSSLTAEWRAKTYWQHRDGDTVKFISTVPVVTYTGSAESEICDISYVPSGYYNLPIKTPTNDYFVEWRQYVRNSATGENIAFNFNNRITTPTALYAKTTAVLSNRVHIPLGGERTVTSSSQSTIYSVYMPYAGEYTLTIEGSATVLVGEYGNNQSQSYSATASSPTTITLTSTEKGQIVIFNITRSSGTVKFKFNGATGETNGTLAHGGEYVQVGDEVILIETKDLAYQFFGWYEGNVKVSKDDDSTYTFTMPNSAKTFTCNRKLYEGLELLDYESSETELIITDVKDKNITSVILPPTVTSIGNYAFYNCYKLIEVYNKSLLNITAGSSSNGYVAYYAKNVYTTDGGSKLTTIDDGFVIYDNTTLVDYIGKKSVITIPDSVTSIGYSAFYECSGLTSVTIPNSVTSIGYEAFYNCRGLTSVTIGNSVTSIGDFAFYNCRGLTSVTIGNSVTSIGYSAFYECSGLTSITISNSVKSIRQYAFEGCSGLEAVYITDIAKWCGISFSSHDANPLYYAHNLYLNGELVTDLVIPDSVTSIGYSAFYGCSGLTSITIPDSVTSIGYFAFSGCDGLTSITVSSGNTKYHSANNCIIATSSKTLILGCKTSVIPTNGSVTSIGNYAFYECSGLTSVTIPNSVTSIGYKAFYGCSKLTSVTIGNSVTSIDDHAFYGCSGLTSVTIPDSVTSIGNYAFWHCSRLTSIKFDNTSGWYRTNNLLNWENKTNGTSTDVTNMSTNVTYFTDTYAVYFWYKK